MESAKPRKGCSGECEALGVRGFSSGTEVRQCWRVSRRIPLIKVEIQMSIKDMVANGKQVQFVRYKEGELWYVTECGFEFPVPTSDTGEATFLARDKAMLFMRYIRKHLAMLEEARASESVALA
jgi:hypothetical protein